MFLKVSFVAAVKSSRRPADSSANRMPGDVCHAYAILRSSRLCGKSSVRAASHIERARGVSSPGESTAIGHGEHYDGRASDSTSMVGNDSHAMVNLVGWMEYYRIAFGESLLNFCVQTV